MYFGTSVSLNGFRIMHLLNWMVVSFFFFNSSHRGDTLCWLSQGWSWRPENCSRHFAANVYCGLGRTITFLDYHRRQLASTGDGDAKSVFHPRKELRIPKHWWTLNIGILLLDVNFSYICTYTYLYNKSNRYFGLPSMYKTSDQEERCWLNSAWFPLAMSFFPMMSSVFAAILAVFQDVHTWSRPR